MLSRLQEETEGLNPCCNGIYLIIKSMNEWKNKKLGLNPCCNGIYLIIKRVGRNYFGYSLNPCCNGIYLIIVIIILILKKWEIVLILVVMEYT